MSFVEELGLSVKSSLSRAAKSIPFSRYGGNNSYGGFGMMDAASAAALYSSQPGSKLDYATIARRLEDNGVVAACVDSIAQALADAPAILQRRDGDTWKRVPDHPCLDLLHNPNGFYSSAHLWAATAGMSSTYGNGFWRLAWDNYKVRPREIWWEPTLAPVYDENSFISAYNVRVDGKPYRLERDEVVHFRHALNPRNPRWGYSPLQSVIRQIAGDNAAATYQVSILNRSGVASMIVTMKDMADMAQRQIAAQVTPAKVEDFRKKLHDATTGDRAGSIAATSLPLDVKVLGYSPEQLALDKLIAYYESRICAALRVPPMVVGLSAGDATKTYANYPEAIKDFWQRCIQPMQKRQSMDLSTQFLPHFNLDPTVYRIWWDYSEVEALQENEESLIRRLQRACGGPFMSINEARSRAKLETKTGDDYDDVRTQSMMGAGGLGNGFERDGAEGGAAMKSIARALPEDLDGDDLAPWTEAQVKAAVDDLDSGDVNHAYAARTPALKELLASDPREN